MNGALRAAFDRELTSAGELERNGDHVRAFAHLERAHILSQRYAFAHAGVHLRMLRNGWLRRDARELVGQVVRTLAALMFSRIWVPIGNTGGANVNALRPMPVPPDLAQLLD
jgi:hypothetical protein